MYESGFSVLSAKDSIKISPYYLYLSTKLRYIMSVELKKRFDRIVEIMIQLQSKRVIKAQELADRFEVSLRTIYRDIKSLEQAGVPIIGEAGAGYSIVDGYKLPPVIFTKEEALSFIGAEKLMEKYMDTLMIADYKSAIFKIKSVLKYTEKDLISALEKQIKIRRTDYEFFNKDVPQALQIIFKSIASKKQVHIQYKGMNDLTAQNRKLEPIGLFLEKGFWYIAAYCCLRSDYRQFRADRIISIELSDADFESQRLSLDDFLKSQQETIKKTIIKISTSLNLAPYFNWERLHFGFKSETVFDDCIEMLFEYDGNLEYFARWFLMFADESEIIEPQSLKDRVNEILVNSVKRLNQ